MRNDENFKGSVFEKIGYVEERCKKCGAYLYKAKDGSIICLNGCHLPPATLRRFEELMGQTVERVKRGEE